MSNASKPSPPFDQAIAHRWFAVECNNQAWELVESSSRTSEQDEQMLRLAYAAAHHWDAVGTDLNRLRAANLLATACAAAEDGTGAVRHSESCLEWLERLDTDASSESEGNAVSDFDRAAVHGCIAQCLARFVDGDDASPRLASHTQQAQAAMAHLSSDDAALIRKLYPVA